MSPINPIKRHSVVASKRNIDNIIGAFNVSAAYSFPKKGASPFKVPSIIEIQERRNQIKIEIHKSKGQLIKN